MNEVWDLSPLYKGFDDPQYTEDFSALQKAIEEYRGVPAKMNEMDAGAFLHYALSLDEKINEIGSRLGSFTSLRSSTNTQDVDAVSNMARLQRLFSECSAASAAYQCYVGKL